MPQSRSKPQLTGSDGELLVPQQLEASADPRNGAAYAQEDDPDLEAPDAQLDKPKPDAIPHQLFYPLIAVLWIGVLVVYPPLPSYDEMRVNPWPGLGLIVACLVATLLVFVPAALFDTCFPSSTRLSMRQTYTKALKISINFASGGRVRFRR